MVPDPKDAEVQQSQQDEEKRDMEDAQEDAAEKREQEGGYQ
ncbi:hypothetical protein [Sphingobium tyrosinilyticum]|uniref:Uncharacterized protein n=1 Tax=Sphingobium tyrosinilyticum TaxID=2715436 RepID=A0ABV9F2V4_9SPHN